MTTTVRQKTNKKSLSDKKTFISSAKKFLKIFFRKIMSRKFEDVQFFSLTLKEEYDLNIVKFELDGQIYRAPFNTPFRVFEHTCAKWLESCSNLLFKVGELNKCVCQQNDGTNAESSDCKFIGKLLQTFYNAGFRIKLDGFAATSSDCLKNIFAPFSPSQSSCGAFVLGCAQSFSNQDFLHLFFKQYLREGFVKSLEFEGEELLLRDSDTFHLTRALMHEKCVLEKFSFILIDNEDFKKSIKWLFNAFSIARLPRCFSQFLFSHDYWLGDAIEQRIERFYENLQSNNVGLKEIRMANLTLSDNSTVYDHLGKYIASEQCQLERVDLHSTRFQMDYELVDGDDIQSPLFAALQNNKTVTYLNFDDNLCSYRDANDFRIMLTENSVLKHVDVADNCYFDDDYFTKLIPKTTTTLRVLIVRNSISWNDVSLLSDVVDDVFHITHLNYGDGLLTTKDIRESHGQLPTLQQPILDKINKTLVRNQEIVWRKSLHDKIVDFCIGMASLELPPYVLLWIFDELPHMHHASHVKKIRVIEDVMKSIRKVKNDQEEIVKAVKL